MKSNCAVLILSLFCVVFVGVKPVNAAQAAPQTIRVGRSCSCRSCSTVVTVSMETYTKRVLPNEWITSWNANSLRAGAVAIRSYGAYHVYHPAGSTYDICDNTCCQKYGTTQYASTDAAVDATAGLYMVDSSGNIARAEYSAENNNAGCGNCNTGTCLSDTVCCGYTANGHGRGMCQWGTQRWAQAGYAWDWIVRHYYDQYSWTMQNLGMKLYDAAFNNQSYPDVMYPGQESTMWIEYYNRGSSTWNYLTRLATSNPRGSQGYLYSGAWLSPDRACGVGAETPTNGLGRFTLIGKAPSTPGYYVSNWELVQEGTAWFDGAGDDAWFGIEVAQTGDNVQFEAENYSRGAHAQQNRDYYDTTGGNTGGAYRSQDVDIRTSAEGNVVGWTAPGEWMQYYYYNTAAKQMTWSVRYANGGADAVGNLTVNGAIVATLNLPNTGGWDNFVTLSTNFTLGSTGNLSLGLYTSTAGPDYNWFRLDKVAATTSVTFDSIGGEDGWTLESTESSNVGNAVNAPNTTLAVGDQVNNRQYRGILSFDTSAIPDGATISKATLRLTQYSINTGDPWASLGTCTVDIRNGTFGAATLENADFENGAGAGSVATVPKPSGNNVTVGTDLNATGRSNINKVGRTQLKIRFTTDDDNDLTNDYVNFYSGDYATNTAYRPKLIIEYQ